MEFERPDYRDARFFILPLAFLVTRLFTLSLFLSCGK